MQFPKSLRPERGQNGRISTIEVHHLKYLEGNCMRNFSPADERRPQGLRTHIDTFPMRDFSGSSAKKFAQHGAFSGSSAKKLAQHGSPRSSSAKNFAQHAIKHRFWAILSTLGELFRAHTHTRPRRANFFAHSTRRRGNFETSNTFAHHAARSIETAIAFAGSKWPKNGLSWLTKAMAVSFRCKEVLAKVLSVS